MGNLPNGVSALKDFYFFGCEAANWLARTIKVSTASSLTLEQWVAEFHRHRNFHASSGWSASSLRLA